MGYNPAMTMEQREYLLLPRSTDIRDAFTQVAIKHPIIHDPSRFTLFGPDMPWIVDEEVLTAARDFMLAGMAYLANRCNNPYLNKLGLGGFYPFRDGLVPILVTTDMFTMAEKFNLPEPALSDLKEKPEQTPFAICTLEQNGKSSAYSLSLLFPTHFFDQAQENPLLAMTSVTALSSIIRDVTASLDIPDQTVISQRAVVAQADFLYYCRMNHPKEVIDQPMSLFNLMSQYPRGTYDLPEHLRLKKGFLPDIPELDGRFN